MNIKTLKELRENKNITQEQESKKLGITKEYLSMLERGKRNPSDKLKCKISKLFGVSMYYVFLSIEQTKRFNKQNE